ncbi:hypothetical protein ACFLYU_04290 [Candidatus Dependentiae bacterium]
MTRWNQILGTILIVLGFVALFAAIYPFFKNILFFLLGVYLISYGLRMRGMYAVTHYARTIWFNVKRFR